MNTDIIETALADLAEIDGELDRISAERSTLDKRESELSKRKDAWKVILGDDYPVNNAQPSKASSIITRAKQLKLGEKPPLKVLVIEAIKAFNGSEFNTPDIEQWLINNGKLPDISQPRAQIKTTLNRLEAQGLVELSHIPDAGQEPHRYRVRSKINEI